MKTVTKEDAMAYDEHLADRVRQSFAERFVTVEEKKMMGGLCFMVNAKMCAGIVGETLMARIDPEIYQQALSRPGARQMDFTGRPMKGFVFVEPEGIDEDEDLQAWLQLCLDYNPRARSSKRKAAKK
jgi:TfoX/Sxy family transcriptional regulator of competence genes